MKFLLDTDICIYVINERPKKVLAHFLRQTAGAIGVSSISVAELSFGAAKSGSARNQAALEAFLLPLQICEFDAAAAQHYGVIRAKLEKAGKPVGPLDLLIAAHALSLDITLVTNNTREFARIAGLTVENWARD